MATGSPDPLEHRAERVIREAIEAGEFEDLPGVGKPIPGSGTVDDDLWWVRSWVRRNCQDDDDEPSNSS
jgi:hypothetical protein